MEISISLIFLSSLLITPNFITIEAQFTDCQTTQCDRRGPKIQSPFRVQGREVSQCGRSGFELSCQGNNTTIHFPSYGTPLVVKSISYDQKTLNLIDPNGCVHGVFMNLNLSLTPFHYFYAVKDYLYLNCTAKIPSLSEVPCLSQYGSHVYVLKPSLMEVPSFCKAVKTVAIPFEYSPYLAGDSFGLSLTWGFHQSKTGFQTPGFLKATKIQLFKISFLATMAAILMVIMKINHSKKQNYSKEEVGQMVFDPSLGTYDYEALRHN